MRGSKKRVFTGERLFLTCGNSQSQSKLFCNKEEKSEMLRLKNKIIFITCPSQMSLRERWETSIHCFVFYVLVFLLLFKVSHFFLGDFATSVYFPCHRYNSAVSCNPRQKCQEEMLLCLYPMGQQLQWCWRDMATEHLGTAVACQRG